MTKVDNYFGGCPHCGETDGFLNVGRDHWFFCKAHKTKWNIGSNLFSGWREQTEEEQRRIYNEIGMGDFTVVEPLPCTDPRYQLGHEEPKTMQTQTRDAMLQTAVDDVFGDGVDGITRPLSAEGRAVVKARIPWAEDDEIDSVYWFRVKFEMRASEGAT